MKVVGLLSGGKDSCYNLVHCAQQGHDVVALATLAPPEGKDELDSYMYQTVGHDAVHLVAQAMELPLYRHVITGKPLQTGAQFGIQLGDEEEEEEGVSPSTSTAADETEDLHQLLAAVKADFPDVQGVSVGAILSNYQRFRVETICARPSLALTPLAYLWQRSQSALLAEMVSAGLEAVLIKVAGIGLKERHLGRSLAQMQPELTRLNAMYGAHVCGEGGEYETLTLDSPLFKKRIQLDRTEVVVHAESDIAPVAYLRIHAASLQDKKRQDSEDSRGVDVIVPPLLDGLARRTRSAARGSLDAQQTHSPSAAPPRPVLPLRAAGTQPTLRIRRKGNWVAIHGAIPVGTSDSGDADAQVYQAFEHLRAALATHDLALPHIQHIDLAIRSQHTFAATNAVYKRHFGVEPPSRACVALPHLRIHSLEMDAVAYDDGSRYSCSVASSSKLISAHANANPSILARQTSAGDRPRARQALHVQSLSYWASANIGPYSQAVSAASRVSISGQIGLRPVDLSLPAATGEAPGAREEAQATQIALSLQHARRIFDALLEERGRRRKGWVEGGVCWLAGRGPAAEQADDALLLAAAAAWGAQGSNGAREEQEEGEPGDEGDDDDDDDDATGWIFGTEGFLAASSSSASEHRPTAGAHALPLLYATVAHDGLPRGACVEWQLTGHDGRRWRRRARPKDGEGSDDDDDWEQAARPVARTSTFQVALSELIPPDEGEVTPAKVTVHARSLEADEGASAMGIVCLRLDSAESEGAGAGAGEGKGGEKTPALEEVKTRLRAALSVKAFVALGDAVVQSTSRPGLSLAQGQALLDALLRPPSTDTDANAEAGAADLPAHSTAGVHRLATVCAGTPRSADEGARLDVREWDLAMVWRDV